MSDATGKTPEDKAILTDFDQTNGLVDGLGGQDDGVVETDEALEEDRADTSGDDKDDEIGVPILDNMTLDSEGEGAAPEDTDEAVTAYSEEGRDVPPAGR
jgi:hypothetical protein